jgi:hypothetical protein
MLGRMGQEQMRAGDGDRQRVVDRLRLALDEGRLDLGEYDERVQRAYAAKTYGDLDGLLDDLPGTVPAERSQVEPLPAAAPPVEGGKQPAHGVQGMAFVFVICTLVWVMSGAGYFWPGWVAIPLALALLAHFRERGKRDH